MVNTIAALTARVAELEGALAKMQRSRDRCRQAWEAEKVRARAACLALIENWPGMREARNGSSASLNPHIILPITENGNE